jgi:hypothetical protein
MLVNGDETKVMSDQSSYQYSAVTPLGVVGIELLTTDDSLQKDKEYLNPLITARVLGEQEVLIQSVEDWLRVALDLEPSPVLEGHRVQVVFKLNSTNAEDGTDQARLSFPVKAIPYLPCTTEDLNLKFDIQWGGVSCELVVARFDLSMEQLEAIEPRGLVLVPESFGSHWRCLVRVEGEEQLFFEAELDPRESLLRFNIKPSDAISDHGGVSADAGNGQLQLEVMLHKLMGIRVDRLIGWADHPVVNMGGLLSQLTMDIKESSSVIATGTLLPVASGYGVLIDNIS